MEYTIKVKKLHPDAILPKRANHDDIGIDFYALKDTVLNPLQQAHVWTGIAIEPPPGIWIQIESRSGLASRAGIHVLGGIIDPSYRGEVLVIMSNPTAMAYYIKRGDRIAQGVERVVTIHDLEEVEELSNTERGSGGLGSTGR